MPSWHKLLKDEFGEIVGGDLGQWANRRMRLYSIYTEDDIQHARMDFSTSYSMVTFPEAERNKWMQIARKKLVTHAMLVEKGMIENCSSTYMYYVIYPIAHNIQSPTA